MRDAFDDEQPCGFTFFALVQSAYLFDLRIRFAGDHVGAIIASSN